MLLRDANAALGPALADLDQRRAERARSNTADRRAEEQGALDRGLDAVRVEVVDGLEDPLHGELVVVGLDARGDGGLLVGGQDRLRAASDGAMPAPARRSRTRRIRSTSRSL